MTPAWKIERPSPLSTPILCVEDRLVAVWGTTLEVIDLKDGDTVWALELKSGIVSNILYDGFVLQWVGEDSGIYRAPLDDAITASSSELSGRGLAQLARMPKSQNVAVATDLSLACIGGNYEKVWELRIPAPLNGIGMLSGHVISCTSSEIVARSTKSGEVAWQRALDSAPRTALVWHDASLFWVDARGSLQSCNERGEVSRHDTDTPALPMAPITSGRRLLCATSKGLWDATSKSTLIETTVPPQLMAASRTTCVYYSADRIHALSLHGDGLGSVQAQPHQIFCHGDRIGFATTNSVHAFALL